MHRALLGSEIGSFNVPWMMNEPNIAGSREEVLFRTLFSLSLILVTLSLPNLAEGQQPWSGLLAPNRAITWSDAGATTPTGNFPNCATQPSSQSLSALNSAIAADVGGSSYCVIDISGWGNVNVTGSVIVSYAGNANVIVKGAGPNKTILTWTSSPNFNCNGLSETALCVWNGNSATNAGVNYWGNSASISSGFNQGSTSLTLSGYSGLKVGTELQIAQADLSSDNGNAFFCASAGFDGACSQQGSTQSPRLGGGNGPSYSESQIFTVTSCGTSTFGAPCSSGNVNVTPGVYAPNFTSNQNPTAFWQGTLPVSNVVIDGVAINVSNVKMGILVECHLCSNVTFQNMATLNGTAAGQAGGNHFLLWNSNHVTVANSYLYGSNAASQGYGIDFAAGTADSLAYNNIAQHMDTAFMLETAVGNVYAYNYAVDNFFGGTWQQCDEFHHSAGDYYNLWEGNIGTCSDEDDIHGSAFANTHYRNALSGFDPGSENGTKSNNVIAVNVFGYARYANYVANVLGFGGKSNKYEDAMTSTTDCGVGSNGIIWALGDTDQNAMAFSPTCIGTSFTIYNDLSVKTNLARWGNWDAVTGAVQENSGETGSSAPVYPGLSNPATTFPPSFYLSAQPSWWKFPSGTAAPWPGIGPDVSGGNISGSAGHAYLNPAANCYLKMMGGATDGSSGMLNFDPASCYPSSGTSSTGPSAPINLTGTVVQ